MAIRFEPLRSRHNRTRFASGVGALDEWFRTRATQDQRRHVAQVFVALDGQGVVSLDSLSMFTLARHERAKGSGIGDLLVADAVKRVLAAAESVAAYAIVVDAKDEHGRRFYQSHGFSSLPSRPNRLFLLTETATAALAAAAEPQEGERDPGVERG